MAYLMTDMAEGGKAALQLQQTMAAAPDVQQAQANVMQEQQLKLQQEQQNVEKSRLSNMVEGAKFDAAKVAKDSLEKAQKSPEWPNATDPERLGILAGLTSNPEEAAKIIAQKSVVEAKQVVEQARALENNRQSLSNALGVLSAATTPEKQEQLIRSLPKEQQGAIDAIIGKNSWNALTTPEKVNALRGVIYNTSLQVKQHSDDKKLEGVQITADARKAVATTNANAKIAAKTLGGKAGGDTLAAVKEYDKVVAQFEFKDKRVTQNLVDAVTAAKSARDKERTFGDWWSDKTKKDAQGRDYYDQQVAKAEEELKTHQAEFIRKRMDVADRVFAGEHAKVVKEQLMREAQLLGKPEPKTAVPSNKGPSVGTVQDGYKFKGGDPADPKSWEKV